ncbi:hypothetical protein QTP88_012491 [Uroleucon formosanum]
MLLCGSRRTFDTALRRPAENRSTGGGVQVFSSSSPSLSVPTYDSLGRLIYATRTICLSAVRTSPCSRSFGFV